MEVFCQKSTEAFLDIFFRMFPRKKIIKFMSVKNPQTIFGKNLWSFPQEKKFRNFLVKKICRKFFGKKILEICFGNFREKSS
jgi:hypothetical protein